MLENKNIDLNQYVKSFFSGNGLDLDNALRGYLKLIFQEHRQI